MGYGYKLFSTASIETKKFESIHREGIKIYTGTFRTSPVELPHTAAYDLPIELKKKLRFM